MDHQPQEAGPVDVPTAEPVDTKTALRAALAPAQENAEEPVSEQLAEAEPVEGELEVDDFEEEGEQGDGQETATDAPVSLNAEEKETFGQLPPEAQSFVTALEARRNADVTKVTTKAADAQRVAEANAAQSAIQAKQEYASHLNAFMQSFAPQMPDPNLAQTNPAEYIAMKAQYDAQAGHFDELKNQIATIGKEAEAEDQRVFIETRDKALMQIPEIANPETRQTYLDRVFDPELVGALGFEQSEMAKVADADDIKRLNTIADWREKAAKFDSAMSRKMKRVRAGKPRATKPGVTQPQSSGAEAYNNSVAKLKQTGKSSDARAALRAALT